MRHFAWMSWIKRHVTYSHHWSNTDTYMRHFAWMSWIKRHVTHSHHWSNTDTYMRHFAWMSWIKRHGTCSHHWSNNLGTLSCGQVSVTLMMTSSNGNIFLVTGHLCGEFTSPSEFPAHRPVTQSFDVFFDLRLNKRLSKQSWGWWFEMISCPLSRYRNVTWRSDTCRLSLWLPDLQVSSSSFTSR